MPASHNNNLHLWRSLFAAYLILILLILIGAYTGAIPTHYAAIPWYDTLGHFFLLGILSWLSHRALDRKAVKTGPVKIPLGPLLVSLFITAEESLQNFSPLRTFSFSDLITNLVGIWLFIGVDWMISSQNRGNRT